MWVWDFNNKTFPCFLQLIKFAYSQKNLTPLQCHHQKLVQWKNVDRNVPLTLIPAVIGVFQQLQISRELTPAFRHCWRNREMNQTLILLVDSIRIGKIDSLKRRLRFFYLRLTNFKIKCVFTRLSLTCTTYNLCNTMRELHCFEVLILEK